MSKNVKTPASQCKAKGGPTTCPYHSKAIIREMNSEINNFSGSISLVQSEKTKSSGLEAARLQSFPDWYQFAGPYVQFHGSKEQDKYEQIGDAIPPLLACAIAKEFIISLPNHANE